MTLVSRRTVLTGLAASATGLLVGCDRLITLPPVREALFTAENVHRWTQRALTNRNALAPEYPRDQMSPIFRANGTHYPKTADYLRLQNTQFLDWRLKIFGLVNRPISLSLAQLQAFPQREQITRHDCVEGWSAIGQWRGVPIAVLMQAADLRTTARYLVFHCADDMGGRLYYESIDLVDAFHPQTILALNMNGKPLQIAHGAPARLRAERHLGYKQAKYVMGIQAVSDLRAIHGGKGGYWEDVAGYEWYAGI